MTNARTIVLSLLAVAAVGGGFLLLQSPPAPPPKPEPPAPQPAPAVGPTPVQPATAPAPSTPEPTRTAAPAIAGQSHADAPQGVRGRVLRPDGAPAAGVQVLLLENIMNDMAQIFLHNRMGKTTPPIAVVTTGGDGEFALGVRRLGKSIDLRVISEAWSEFHRQGIKIHEGDWYDTGDIVLEAGLVVQGRVVDAITKAPIADATVFLSSSNQSHTMVASPGRERGIPTITDVRGSFLYTNAPRIGLVNIVAEAPGYASTQLQNQVLKQDGPTELVLELESGQMIAGVVIDQDGKPVRQATVTATGVSAKTPQTTTATTDDDGRFAFPALRTGPYQLAASMSQFGEMKPQLALTGETDVRLVLGSRAMVKLKVLTPTGQQVRAYRVGLKRHFPTNPQNIGNVLDFPDRSITPADHPREYDGEWAVIRGVAVGDYRFQITEPNHAKTLSEPFTVTEGGPTPEVVAVLTLGATIIGTVVDDRGRPVADATVATDMNGGLAADTGLFEFFRTMMPEKHTRAQTKTDAQGRFRIGRLAFADYMLRVAHPRFCEGTAINLRLESEGQVVDAGVIQLFQGAIVEGVTMIDGHPAGQVKVTLSTPMTQETLPNPAKTGAVPPGAMRVLFNASAHSEGDGTFRLLKRVPPGTYRATAQRPGSGSDPFSTLLDMRETEQQVTVAEGQETVTLTFNLSKR